MADEIVNDIEKALSTPRFKTYLDLANGNNQKAIQIYRWNVAISQSLYPTLHFWEVCLRNKINNFLCWKYNATWPYDPRLIRNLNKNDNRRLSETKERQERARNITRAPTCSDP